MLEEMLGATGPLNFTLFLTLMGERVQSASLATESELIEALQHFDDHQTGLLSVENLRDILTTGGGEQRLSEVEFELLLRDAQVDARGFVDYKEFIKTIKQSC